jgi:hypothetical protein
MDATPDVPTASSSDSFYMGSFETGVSRSENVVAVCTVWNPWNVAISVWSAMNIVR